VSRPEAGNVGCSQIPLMILAGARALAAGARASPDAQSIPTRVPGMPTDDVIDLAELRQELIRPAGLWQKVDLVPETGSTNADLAARARQDEVAGTVLITDYQSAGRGRQGRTWTAPPGSGIAMSILVRPDGIDPSRWSWLSLLAGLAVSDGVRRAADLPAVLKWPNDVLIADRKVCGILSERVDTSQGPACVVGIGVNVNIEEDQLPVPSATSLTLAARQLGGPPPSRTAVIATVLAAFELLYGRWEAQRGSDPSLAASYAERCETIGRHVRVLLSEERSVEGIADGIDEDGRLVVRTISGSSVYGAGDVIHLQP
jgi:BirA family transcriptional regulator, biotin operon repressor / biotin---[acetyl-CoA-carboxylase] ligase